MRKKILFLVFFVVFFFGMIGLFFNTTAITKKNTNNTTQYIATVKNVFFLTNNQKTSVEINTNEYSTKLYISESLCTDSTLLAIKAIENGDTIYFRINNDVTEIFRNEISFCNIVSLETAEKTIISLSDYNSLMQKSTLPAKIIAFILASCLLFCIIKQSKTIRQLKINHSTFR